MEINSIVKIKFDQDKLDEFRAKLEEEEGGIFVDFYMSLFNNYDTNMKITSEYSNYGKVSITLPTIDEA